MSNNTIGAFIGLLFAAGFLLLVSRWRATRKLKMIERIAPFIGRLDVRPVDPSAIGALLLLLKPQMMARKNDSALGFRLNRAGRAGE